MNSSCSVSAHIKVYPRVTCRICALQVAADSFNLNTGLTSPEDLKSVVETSLQTHFVSPPVGWEVSGRDNYTCPNCANP